MKQVIVVRADLKMGRGKLAVQVAHASLSSALQARSRRREWFDEWIGEGQKKIAVKASGLKELMDVMKMSAHEGIPHSIVEDRGLTQLEPGTVTCVGVGPAPADLVDRITARFKLL